MPGIARVRCGDGAAGAAALILIAAQTASGQVSIPNRPFGIDAETMHCYTDGFFDVILGVQAIGVYVRNDGPAPLHNVGVMASFEDGSGIIMIEPLASLDSLEPGVATLMIFKADFSGTTPDKHALTLEVVADGFAQSVSRPAFVMRSEPLSGTTHTVTCPEGTMTVVLGPSYPSDSFGSTTAPMLIDSTIDHTPPFSGQFSPLPYGDPWWKAFGLGFGLAGCAGWAVGAVAEECGASWGKAVKEVGQAEAAAGGLCVAADDKDPFRRGQENTLPPPDAVTFSERVILSANYLQEPEVGTLYQAAVSFQYQRFTDRGVFTCDYSAIEQNNIHYTTGRALGINKHEYGTLDQMVLTAQIERGVPLRGNEAFITANVFRAADTFYEELPATGVLRDDGQAGDAAANDGIYTLARPVAGLPIGEPLKVFVFGFDINQAAESDPPLVAATKIGGVLISAPAMESCGMTEDFLIIVSANGTCPADLTGDGLVDFSDYLEFLNLYEAEDPRADYNRDGIVDFLDYLEFLNYYDAGC